MSIEQVLKSLDVHELSLAQMRVARITEDFNQNLAKRHGVTPIEWLMLSRIAKHSPQGIRVTDLARIFDVKTTYITAILNSLRAKAYIDTQLDSRDARVRLAVITEAGSTQLMLIEQALQQTITERLEGVIPARDFERYASVLIRLARI